MKVAVCPFIVVRLSGCLTTSGAAPEEELELLDEDELDELLELELELEELLELEEELLELEEDELELDELLELEEEEPEEDELLEDDEELELEEELEDEDELEEEELLGVVTVKPVKFILLNWLDPPPRRRAIVLKVVVGVAESVAV